MMYYNNYGGNFSEGIREGIKNSFRKGSSLTRLIYINCGIFLALKLIYIMMLLLGKGEEFYPTLLEWIGVPADPEYLLSRPWTIFTYMFTQFDFLHLLFNMLWLYWFGSFFLNYFTERKLTGVYLLGGLFGGLLYIAAYNIFPYFSEPQISPFPRPALRLTSWAIGSSAYPVPMCHPLIGDRQRKRNIPARHPYFPPFSPHCRHFPSAQPFSPGLSPSQSCRYAA